MSSIAFQNIQLSGFLDKMNRSWNNKKEKNDTKIETLRNDE